MDAVLCDVRRRNVCHAKLSIGGRMTQWGTRKSTWEERLREDAEGLRGRRGAFHYRSSRCCSYRGARYCDTHGRIKHTGGGDYLDWNFFLPLFDGRWWSQSGIIRWIQVGVCTKLLENCCPRKGQQLPLLWDRLREPPPPLPCFWLCTPNQTTHTMPNTGWRWRSAAGDLGGRE